MKKYKLDEVPKKVIVSGNYENDCYVELSDQTCDS